MRDFSEGERAWTLTFVLVVCAAWLIAGIFWVSGIMPHMHEEHSHGVHDHPHVHDPHEHPAHEHPHPWPDHDHQHTHRIEVM